MDLSTSITQAGRRIRHGSILFWLAVSTQAFCQEPRSPDLKGLSLEQLSQIEVTSVTKDAIPAFKTPAAISVMTSADIRRTGARNIPDLLRLIPGVNVAQIGSSEWAIGVRGFQGKLSKSVLVLIDGRSVYTPLFAGVYWEMQDTLIEDIDRIEVIRGPGGTIWGSNAINGVVNIITKSARETRGSLVSAGGGNVEQGFLNWRYGGGTDAFSYRVFGKGFTRGPQQHADGRNFDDWRRGQLGFRTDWRASARDEVTIQGDVYGARAGQKLQISQFSPPSIAALEANKLFNGQNVMAAWRRALASGSDLQVRTYWDRTNRRELNYQEVRNTFDVDLIHHIPLTRHDVTWGLGARVSPSRFFQTVSTVDFQPHEQTYNIFSAFVQDDMALVPNRLSLQIGSKFEYTTYSGLNVQPSLRLAWTPTARQTLWSAITRAVRTASRIEDNFRFSFLAQPNPPLYFRLIGDGAFTPEELIGYEFGYRHYLSSRGFLTFSLFHNRYDDLLSVENRPIQPESTPEPAHLVLPLFLRNGIRASGTGGEATALWDITPWLRLRGSYSRIHLDARRASTSNDASTVRQLEGDTPQHKAVVQSYFSLPKGFGLDLIYRYVSNVPNQNVPSYSTGDVHFSRRLSGNLELSIVGQNLLQPSHLEYGGTPGPLVGIRRGGYLTLTWTH